MVSTVDGRNALIDLKHENDRQELQLRYNECRTNTSLIRYDAIAHDREEVRSIGGSMPIGDPATIR